MSWMSCGTTDEGRDMKHLTLLGQGLWTKALPQCQLQRPHRNSYIEQPGQSQLYGAEVGLISNKAFWNTPEFSVQVGGKTRVWVPTVHSFPGVRRKAFFLSLGCDCWCGCLTLLSLLHGRLLSTAKAIRCPRAEILSPLALYLGHFRSQMTQNQVKHERRWYEVIWRL